MCAASWTAGMLLGLSMLAISHESWGAAGVLLVITILQTVICVAVNKEFSE